MEAATYESKSEEEAKAVADENGGAAYVAMWLKALALAEEEQKEWCKRAEEVSEIYRAAERGRQQFNILYSNIETIRPALYNSTPVPDIRRRYSDEDPVGKVVSDILDRGISYAVDSYDFDEVMKAVVHDGELVGRGVPRVRYKPYFDETGEALVYQEVSCEYVPWRRFKRGPGLMWSDVPWVSICDFLSREALRDLCGDAVNKDGKPLWQAVPLNYTAEKKEGHARSGEHEQSIFRAAKVEQIWDKENRKVISICPDYPDAPLARVDDPLGLVGFFPVPRPYQPVFATDSSLPIVPYQLYEGHVDDLNEVTRRISVLVRQLRVRGGYASDQADSIKKIAGLADGELEPLEGVSHLVADGGLDRAIIWWPTERIVAALSVLVEQRDQIKQIIYEITGIADILRGATNPNETLGAQQLKAQWGSLRIQERQTEVARIARDLFRMKAEIIASKFSWDTLSQMTGISAPSQQEKMQAQAIAAATQQPQMEGQPAPQGIPPELEEMLQQPSREDVEEVLREDVMRSYRIDIESDSTIRGDLSRNQSIMNNFLQGTAQFAAAMGPLVMQSPQLLPMVFEIYAAFARQFKLGRQAEAAIDKAIDGARKQSQQPPQPPQPDPKAEAAKAKAGADIKKAEMQMERDTRKHQMDMERMEREDTSRMLDMAASAQQQQMPVVPGLPIMEIPQ